MGNVSICRNRTSLFGKEDGNTKKRMKDGNFSRWIVTRARNIRQNKLQLEKKGREHSIGKRENVGEIIQNGITLFPPQVSHFESVVHQVVEI